MKLFFRDFLHTVRIAPVWWYMAYQDLVSRYRRTTIGPWWITLGTGIGVGSMGLVWGSVFNANLDEFFPYLITGFVIWAFISVCVVEGPLIYILSAPMMRTIQLPLLTFNFTYLLRHIFTFLHNAVIILLAMIFFKVKISMITLLVIPGLFILFLTAFFSSIVLGILGARLRDLSYIISSFMTFLFMLTPVMWDPKILTGKKILLAYANPFTYFLGIVRDPLLNRSPDLYCYMGALGILTSLILLSIFLYQRYSHRLVYWV
jgi:ABC-type polysaccharide/polyol phosphate export permease